MTIHKQIAGKGPALVLLHGWGMHGGVWRGFVPMLALHAQVICLDLPGHGGSGGVSPYTADAVADVLLNAVPAEKFGILGWSLGGTLALAIARRCPQRVQSLFMLSANPKFVQSTDWPGMEAQVLDAFIDRMAANPQLTQQRFLALQVHGSPEARRLLSELKQLLAESNAPDAEALKGGLQILKDADLRAELGGLAMPATVIMGDKDHLIPPACATALKDLQPALNVRVIENAGHVLFLSHPKQLLDIVVSGL
ncbi:MAG: pimeloyl-ACP methyl ester esterase BioH [Methylomonas sp.]